MCRSLGKYGSCDIQRAAGLTAYTVAVFIRLDERERRDLKD
jgi:hypothetical protein